MFQFNFTHTEEDYVAFNHFHSLESVPGKKAVKKSRIIFVSMMLLLIVFVVFMLGWTPYSTIVMATLAVFTLLYMLLFKKVLKRTIKGHIKRLKKTGKLPFDHVSTFEFHEDKLVEITASSRTEESYGIIERVCIVGDRYIYLYRSSVSAYMLPIPQIKAQTDYEAFLSFLSQKCKVIETY